MTTQEPVFNALSGRSKGLTAHLLGRESRQVFGPRLPGSSWQRRFWLDSSRGTESRRDIHPRKPPANRCRTRTACLSIRQAGDYRLRVGRRENLLRKACSLNRIVSGGLLADSHQVVKVFILMNRNEFTDGERRTLGRTRPSAHGVNVISLIAKADFWNRRCLQGYNCNDNEVTCSWVREVSEKLCSASVTYSFVSSYSYTYMSNRRLTLRRTPDSSLRSQPPRASLKHPLNSVWIGAMTDNRGVFLSLSFGAFILDPWTPNIAYRMIRTVSPAPILIPSIPARFGQAVYRPPMRHHPAYTALRCIGLGVSIVIW